MAALYVTEYADLARNDGGLGMPMGKEPKLASQKVAIGGSSAQSSAFNSGTRFVMVHADEVCSIAFGANPTATDADDRMAAGETRFYGVQPGHKVAVITNS